MASPERASFAYQPLVEPDAIRLIVLQPAQALSAPLQCNIEHTTLSKEDRELAEHYIALSYVWGDTVETRTVTVDGFLLDVTASLESALCHIRDETRTLRVWADAICINQSDVAERNQQVKQMASVYSIAHHTIIFLGASDDQIDSSFDLLQSTSRRPGGLIAPPELPQPNALQLLKSTIQKDVLKRAWFSRVWVFQELVLSQNPWVQCGVKRIRWDDLCNFSVLAGDGTPKLNITGSGMELIRDGNLKGNEALQRLGKMQRARHAFQDQKRGTSTGNTLLDLLIERRGLGASDARDMIYAHLGLATDYIPQKFPLEVDYSKSAGEVFTELARFFLEMHKDFRILDYLEGPNQDNRRRGLASWAPDWTVKNSLLVAEDFWLGHDANYSQIKPRFYLSISNDKTTQLICKGTVIGRVVQIGDKILSFPKSQEPEVRRAWDSYLVGGSNKIQESEGAAVFSEKYRIYGADGESYDERRGLKVLEMLLDDWAHEIGLPIKAEPWSDELTDAPDSYRAYARALGHMIKSLEASHVAVGLSVRPLQWIAAYHFLHGEPSAYDLFNLAKEPSLADLTQITGVLEGRRVCAFDIDSAYQNVKPESPQSPDAGMRLPYEHLVSAPRWTQVGDMIVILQGSQRTFIIRPSTRRKASPMNNIDKHYEIVGQCMLCSLSKRGIRGPPFWDENFALD